VRKGILWSILVLLVILLGSCTQAHPKSIVFGDLVSNSDRYHGKNVCAEGICVSGFETSALGASTYRDRDVVYLAEPAIWLEGADVVFRRDCFSSGAYPPHEFCQVRACGLFEAGGSYGHAGVYKFQIRGHVGYVDPNAKAHEVESGS
jgi:hypothetical protein